MQNRKLHEENLRGGFCELPVPPVPGCSIHIQPINIHAFLEDQATEKREVLKTRNPLCNESCQFGKKTHAGFKTLADKKTPRGPIAFTETLGHDSPGTQSDSSGTLEVPCYELLERGVVHLGNRKAKSPLQGVVNPV